MTPEQLLERANLLRVALANVALDAGRLTENGQIALVEAQVIARDLQAHFRPPVEKRAATIPGYFDRPRTGHTGPLAPPESS